MTLTSALKFQLFAKDAWSGWTGYRQVCGCYSWPFELQAYSRRAFLPVILVPAPAIDDIAGYCVDRANAITPPRFG